ncbi:hypothetical protein AGMMS49942_12320 [Spirochaetia bacterium]|nr:hypothetical protein AGMMS49942_12320 [Spirochaetia bacterium]
MLYRNPIPIKEEPFHAYVGNQLGIISVKSTFWEISTVATDILGAKASPYMAAYTVCQRPNSGPLDYKIRDAARVVLQPALKEFHKVYLLYNDKVSDEDKILLGFVLVTNTREKAKKPVSRPAADVEYGVGILRFHFRDEFTTHRGKPAKVQSMQMVYCFSRTQPVHMDEFIHSASATASPLEIYGAEDQRGETMWFRLRWVGPTSLEGPWSEFFSAIMP